MGEPRAEQVLRECIREILAEDMGGFGGDMYGDYAGLGLHDAAYGMGFGAHFGSKEDLYNIFVKPFVDVVKTTAGKTKEVSRRGQELAAVALEALATSLIPALSSNYNRIFEKGKKDLEKIRQEYAEVYKANWDAFKNEDILIAAFAYRPDLFLTAKFAKDAPKATAQLMSVLSGGALDNALSQLLGKGGGKGGTKADLMRSLSDGHLREDSEGQVSDETPLMRLATNSKVHELLASSPIVRRMSTQGQNLVQGMLRDVFKQAQNVMAAKSVDDLGRRMNQKVPGADKLAKVPDAERQKVEQLVLATTKKSMKEFYVKNLESQVKEAVAGGVPKDHPFVQAYAQVISKIKAL